MTAGLDAWLASRSDRCPHGWVVAIQGCTSCGQALKFKGQAITSAAHAADRQKVDAAIKQLASRGGQFSSNDARKLHYVTGAAAKSGLIVRVGYEPSTEPGTHAHPVAVWRAAA